MTVHSSKQIEDSFKACAAAFDSGRTLSADFRESQLLALEKLLTENESALCAALHSDMQKPAGETWLTELSFTRLAARHARKNLRRWMRPRKVPTPLFIRPGRSWIQHEPLGTVLIIAAWNYPLMLCLAPLVTAISSGNCAVIKPSELAPAFAECLADLLPRYLDKQCFAVINGGVDTSTELLEKPWGHIVFTGGDRVAKIVMQAAAKHLTPVTLELGGKSPCVVLPDANLEVTARRIVWGRFTNSGQTCIAPDHVLCDAETARQLIPLLQKAITRMFGEDPVKSPDYARIVNNAHFERLTRLVEDAPVVIGGQTNAASRYIAPTVAYPATRQNLCMQEEIFGPLLPVIEVENLDKAIRFIGNGPKPLAAYLFTASRSARQRFSRSVSAGSICINDVFVFMANDELPFGGVGNSGTGTYAGEAGFHRLSHAKAVVSRSFWLDFKVRYAPLTQNKLKWLRRFR